MGNGYEILKCPVMADIIYCQEVGLFRVVPVFCGCLCLGWQLIQLRLFVCMQYRWMVCCPLGYLAGTNKPLPYIKAGNWDVHFVLYCCCCFFGHSLKEKPNLIPSSQILQCGITPEGLFQSSNAAIPQRTSTRNEDVFYIGRYLSLFPG